MKRLLLALCALLIASPAFAGSMTLLGAGKFGSGGGGGSTSSYVTWTLNTGDGNTHTFNFDTTGAVAGDILIVYWTVNHTSDDLTAAGTPTVVGSGTALTKLTRDVFTSTNGNQVGQSAILWKVLTSADLTSGGANTGQLSVPLYNTFDNFFYSASIWHGGTTVTNKGMFQSVNGTDTTITASGYAQSAGTSVFMSYLSITGGTVSGTYAPPSPFVDTPVDGQYCCATGAPNTYITSAGTTNISATSYVFGGYASGNPTGGSHAGQFGYLLQIQ